MAQGDSSALTSQSLRAFSLYGFVTEEAARRGLVLRELGRVDDALQPATPGVFDASVRAMHHWCRLNEQLVLDRHADGARLLVGFERMSRVRPVLARYRRLASAVSRLTLFAELDEVLPFGASAVDVAGSPMAREWFLVIDAPNYKTLLVARDQQGFGPTGPLVGRRFVGVSSHDTKLVHAAIDAIDQRTTGA